MSFVVICELEDEHRNRVTSYFHDSGNLRGRNDEGTLGPSISAGSSKDSAHLALFLEGRCIDVDIPSLK